MFSAASVVRERVLVSLKPDDVLQLLNLALEERLLVLQEIRIVRIFFSLAR